MIIPSPQHQQLTKQEVNTLTRNYIPYIDRLVTACLMLFICVGLANAVPNPPEKMKPEDVVAKHLASIGTPEDIAAAKTRILTGEDKARIKLATTVREVSGPAQFASDGNKVLLAMIFNASNYPYEKAAFNGDKFTIAGLPTGGRSSFANFLMSQEVIFKHGLIGGSLSSAWPLLNLDPEKAKLSYAGTSKIDGRETHKLRYEPRKSDLKINLFFDAETFRHVRSEYEYTVSARMGSRPSGGVQGPQGNTGSNTMTRYKLVEEFSNFQPTGKLTLPRVYKLEYSSDGAAQNFQYMIEFSQAAFDQAIDPVSFTVSSSE